MKHPKKLFNSNFFLLWQGQSISQIGNQVAIVTMLLWIKETTNSATLVGLITMLPALPVVLLGPIGGTLADRYARRKIIILSDLVNGVVVIILSLLIFFFASAKNLILIVLFFVAIWIAIVDAFFAPAIAASIPDLVPKEKVATANSLNQASVQIAKLIGYGIGGVLFRLIETPLLLLFNGITYLLSAFSESFIEIPQTIPQSSPNWDRVWQEFQRDLVAGFNYVWQQVGLRMLFLAAAGLNVFATPIFVLLPFYVEDFLLASPDWYGFLMAAFGGGSLVGYLVASIVHLSGKIKSILLPLLVLAASIIFVLLGLIHLPSIALILMLLLGMMLGIVNVVAISTIQLTTPSEIRGRVFGLLITLSNALTPIAMGISGLIADWTGQNIPLIYLICGCISGAIAISLSFSQQLRQFLATEIL